MKNMKKIQVFLNILCMRKLETEDKRMDENQSDIFHFIILNLWNGGGVHEYEWLNRDTRMLGRVKFLPEVKAEPARKNGIIDETRRRLEDWKNGRICDLHIFVYFERSVLFPLKSTILKIHYTFLQKYFCDSRQNK